MKNIVHFSILLFSLFLIGCEGEPAAQNEKIEVSADEAKEAIDDLANKAKKFLDGDGIDKLKNVIDNVADKGKGINEDSKIWKEKLESIKDDEDLKALLKQFEGEGKQMERKLNSFAKAIEEDPALKEQVESIRNHDDLEKLLKSYEGPAKIVLEDLEGVLRKFQDNGILQKKLEELENDQELKELIKKYEKDGKEIIEQLEGIFGKKAI